MAFDYKLTLFTEDEYKKAKGIDLLPLKCTSCGVASRFLKDFMYLFSENKYYL